AGVALQTSLLVDRAVRIDVARHRAQVHAGGEVALRAGEDGAAQVVVLAQLLPRVGHQREHRKGHRVLPLRAVHRDDHHVAVAFHLDLGHVPSSRRTPRPRACRGGSSMVRGYRLVPRDVGGDMPLIDPRVTFHKVEERLATETDAVLRRNLETLLTHMKAEAIGDIDGLLQTLTDHPHYHAYGSEDPGTSPIGRDGVRAFYEGFIASGAG